MPVGLCQCVASALTGQLDAQQIQGVVDADAHAQRDHRQGRDLDAHAQHHHQRFAENRGDYQRHHGHHHRAPAAEGDEAQHDDRRVHVHQHGQVGLLDHDVSRRFDPGAAGGQQELAVRCAMRGGEGLCGLHHLIKGLRLMIGEIGHHRHHRAVIVE
ncbi:hypothetical protein D3C85_900790 [compost metagenome]